MIWYTVFLWKHSIVMLKKFKSIFQRKKRFRKEKLLLLIFFLSIPFVLLICDLGFRVVLKHQEQKRIHSISSYFDHEKNITLKKVQQVQDEGELEKYMPGRDTLTLSGILYRFVQKYNLWALAVVDKNGVAVARFPSLRVGDYVFQTSPWGLRVGKGETLVTVVQGKIYPLVLLAGVPFLQENAVQGALFGGHLLNDTYALDFKKKYLERDEELVFYSLTGGVYGTTFENQQVKDLLKLYFNEGTDWVQRGKSDVGGELFQVGERFFHVGNIRLQGLNGDVGGILVFFEADHHKALFFGSVLCLLLFVFIYTSFVKEFQKKKLYVLCLPFVFIITVSLSVCFLEWKQHGVSYKIDAPSYSIYNSTISLLPEFGLFSLYQEQSIQIQIKSGGEPINAIELFLTFDPHIARVEDILLLNSLCDKKFILKKNIDNENGTVGLSCLIPEGFEGETALLAELIIQPLRVGKFDLTFGKESKILAHDGLGTNVLRTTSDGSYTVVDQESSLIDNRISLFSYSHPNSARWYKNKNIHIEWSSRTSTENFFYAFDSLSTTIPNERNMTTQRAIDLSVKKDGVYFFHIARESGASETLISRLKILVDTTPPEHVDIKSSADRVKQGDVVRFEFSGSDSLSGVQANYYVSMDGRMFFPSLKRLYIPFLEKGEHTLTLRVFDNAGNFRDIQKTIAVY